MPNKIKLCTLLFLLLIFPSCTRLIDWGKVTFNQACKVENYSQEVSRHVRSVHIYDQLSTLAIFDVLLLTDRVAELAQSKPFKKTSFFVLAFAPHTDNKPLNAGKENQWGWKVSLLVNNTKLEPVALKCIDMPGQYKFLLGNKWSQFKNAYLITFDYDIKPTDEIIMCFNSLRKKASLTWSFVNGQLQDLKKECCLIIDCDKC